ncbi:MAG: right-handed parallel beta-helix repeat-containing protein [Butyrivibrio sp.]|nr:right-handed parallel beta-helix repeat-containing protein [Butyrivibrio sp.]
MKQHLLRRLIAGISVVSVASSMMVGTTSVGVFAAEEEVIAENLNGENTEEIVSETLETEETGGEETDEAVTESSATEAVSTETTEEESTEETTESVEETATEETAETTEETSEEVEETSTEETTESVEDTDAEKTAETTEETSEATEEASTEETSEATEEASTEETSEATEETSTEEADAATEGSSTEADAATEETTTTEAATQTDADTEAEVEVKYAPLEYSEQSGDYIVSVSVEDGILPEGTTVKIVPVDQLDGVNVEDLIKNYPEFENGIAKIVSFDISFWNNETEIEPANGSVAVNFQLADDFVEAADEAARNTVDEDITVEETDKVTGVTLASAIGGNTGDVIKVFHIDDNANVEEVESTLTDGNVVSVSADSFSIYSIIVIDPVVLSAVSGSDYDFTNYVDATEITIDSSTVGAIYNGNTSNEYAARLLKAALGFAIETNDNSCLPNVEKITIGEPYITDGISTTSTCTGFGIYSNKTLDLNGSTLKLTDTNNLIRSGNPDDVTTAGTYSYENITIKNGTLDGGKYSVGLTRFARVNGLTLENLTFTNFTEHAAEIAGVKNCTITNCKFENPYYSSTPTGGNEALAFDMTSNDKNFKGYAPADYLPVSNVTISNCSFTGSYRGLGSHHYKDNVFNTNITVDSCTFTNITDTAVMGVGWKNSTIKNSTFNSVNMGVDFKQPVNQIVGSSFTEYSNANCTVTGCSFTIVDKANKVADAVRLGGFDNTDGTNSSLSKKIYYVGGYTISDNKVSGSPDDGFTFQYATNSTASGNTVDSSTGNGMQLVYTENCTFSSNIIGECAENNIYVKGGTDNTVSDNTVSNAKKNGIHMNNAAANVTVTGNTVNSSKKNGIAVIDKCTGVIINNNSVNNVGNYGLHVSVKGTVVNEMYCNTITKAKKCGIMVSQNARVKKTKDNVFVKQKKKKRISVSSGGTALFIFPGEVSLKAGKSKDITLYGTTTNLKVKSNNKKVATATKSSISAKKKGKAVITMKAKGVKAQVTVTVK